MHLIQLPQAIRAGDLPSFLSLIGQPLSLGEITVDFSRLRRLIPAAIVSLVATVNLWKTRGIRVEFKGLQECPILSYLQRMDLLNACGFEMPEEFHRRNSKGRFVAVRTVIHPIESMAAEVASCLAPGGEDFDHPNAGLFETISYVLTELGNNIRQHSSGTGYAAAQVNQDEGIIRMSFADNGVGILRSFQIIEAPWSLEATHSDAITKALESRVSCKAGPPNEGVGLTLVMELISMMGGGLLVASGNGVVKGYSDGIRSQETLPDGAFYKGTLVAMSFPSNAAARYVEFLQKAKIKAGVLQPGLGRATFEP